MNFDEESKSEEKDFFRGVGGGGGGGGGRGGLVQTNKKQYIFTFYAHALYKILKS